MNNLGVVISIDENLIYKKVSKIAPYSDLEKHFIPASDDDQEYYLLPVMSSDEKEITDWVKRLNGDLK